MTGQSLLDIMEMLNPELQLQSGEANVAQGLTALNVSQDFFESFAAVRPNIFGSSVGTVATTAGQETTTFPSGVLRIDGLQLLGSNSRPVWDLKSIRKAGGHATTSYWPINVLTSTGTGKPRGYWTNGTNIYWTPVPSSVENIRYMGFSSAASITASGTFAYVDICALPIASFAVRLMKLGVEDETKDIASLAQEAFKPTLDMLASFNRDGAAGFTYSEPHNT